jgi:hypothetical protein
MITVYPDDFWRDIVHEHDLKSNPRRHHLTKDKYSRQEMQDMCVFCAEYFNWKDNLVYDVRTDSYYKR